MTREEFIKGISISVQESAVKTVIHELTASGHARPNMQRVAWYSSLPPHDREQVVEVVRFAVDMALFGFLCVLDGVRTFEDSRDKGDLRLVYTNVNGAVEVQLNGSGGNDLHDIFHDYITWRQ
jgi:hypothetical protein